MIIIARIVFIPKSVLSVVIIAAVIVTHTHTLLMFKYLYELFNI